MKILLIMPDAHMHRVRIGPYGCSLREAPLTLTTLAALVPADVPTETRLVDESVETVPLDYPADLVGISAITGCARRAYTLADHFRRRGIPVVLGGVHVSIIPEEARPHADALVVGMAERSWPRLLRDFQTGHMQPLYRDDPPEEWLAGVPTPRRDLQRRGRYLMPNTVQATRGCKRNCDFCTAPVVWPHYLKRPVSDIIADVQSIPGHSFVFNDVSLVEDRAYAKELFTALRSLRKRWGGLATLDVAKDPELLDLMADSGCMYLLLGFESASQSALQGIHKGFNKVSEYRTIIGALHEHGITVQGCFVFGFDHDDRSVFRDTVDLVNDLGVDIPRYSLYTPYPGTALFQRLQAEKRIISYNWDDYDTMHVVINPARMSADELYAGFKWAYRETFRAVPILRRALRPNLTSFVNLLGNTAYRIFVHRLYTEKRYAQPYTREDPGAEPRFHPNGFICGERRELCRA